MGISAELTNAAQQVFQQNQMQTEQMLNSLLPNRELLNKIHQYGLQQV